MNVQYAVGVFVILVFAWIGEVKHIYNYGDVHYIEHLTIQQMGRLTDWYVSFQSSKWDEELQFLDCTPSWRDVCCIVF